MSNKEMSQNVCEIHMYFIMSLMISYLIVKIMSVLSGKMGFYIYIGIILILMTIGKLNKKKRDPIKIKNFETQIIMAFLKTSLN